MKGGRVEASPPPPRPWPPRWQTAMRSARAERPPPPGDRGRAYRRIEHAARRVPPGVEQLSGNQHRVLGQASLCQSENSRAMGCH
jgi:hypothetical protein